MIAVRINRVLIIAPLPSVQPPNVASPRLSLTAGGNVDALRHVVLPFGMEAGSRVLPAALAIDLDQQSGFSRREYAR
jgi:hypothetical protein